MDDFLLGAITMAAGVIGLYFLRFWRTFGDRFFLYFALAFWIEGLSRVHIAITNARHEDAPEYYLIRLLAYSLILLAVWEKNRANRRAG